MCKPADNSWRKKARLTSFFSVKVGYKWLFSAAFLTVMFPSSPVHDWTHDLCGMGWCATERSTPTITGSRQNFSVCFVAKASDVELHGRDEAESAAVSVRLLLVLYPEGGFVRTLTEFQSDNLHCIHDSDTSEL